MSVQEYSSGAEMRAAYAARRARLFPSAPVVVKKPPGPPPFPQLQPDLLPGFMECPYTGVLICLSEAPADRSLKYRKLEPNPITRLGECPYTGVLSSDFRPKVEEIQRETCAVWGITRADLISDRRTWDVVRPRQAAVALAKHLTLRSLPEIGRRFGGRDHTTILHAVKKMERVINKVAGEIRENAPISVWVRAIKAELETTNADRTAPPGFKRAGNRPPVRIRLYDAADAAIRDRS